MIQLFILLTLLFIVMGFAFTLAWVGFDNKFFKKISLYCILIGLFFVACAIITILMPVVIELIQR